MIHIVDIWSYSISEWSIFTLNTKVSLFISQVVKWLDAVVALQNSNGKSLLYISQMDIYTKGTKVFHINK